MSFRPQADGRYLARPRLVDRLPDAPGFVVSLEAPYGYGKSVLASQWAARLEAAGWRTTWLAVGGRSPRSLLATELGLPAGSPWSAMLDLLWSRPTLLVLEDLESLEDPEELSPLLKDVRGLLLLAGRGPVPASEMPRLLTSGRLVRLGPEELGFTDAEAAQLFDDAETAQRLWSRSSGWPLPLHFASLTGGLPDDQALVAGIRSSLAPEAWDEALLLATLPQLPTGAAVPATRALARSGFVQMGEAGFRLHALVAEAIVAAHGDAAHACLKRAADRLPTVDFGEALERLGDHDALRPLLEEPRAQAFRKAPETFLRWDALADGEPSALQHVTAAAAHKVLGRFPEAVARLERALEIGGLTPDDEIFALKELVWSLALVDNERALQVEARGEALLDRVDPELAGRFLSDASFVDTVAGRFDAAAAKLERSLAVLPADSAFRSATQINLALNRWDAVGDYDGRVAAQTRTLDAVWRLYPSDAPGQCRDLAMLHGWAGDRATARGYLEQALRGERANPIVGLEARAGLAALDGDAGAFPALLERAHAWGSEYAADVIAMRAIEALPDDAPIADARAFVEALKTSGLAVAAYAHRLARTGARDEALRLLNDAASAYPPRAYQVHLAAARYRVTHDEADLDAFLALTSAGTRILPGLVPIDELPRDRPELAAALPPGRRARLRLEGGDRAAPGRGAGPGAAGPRRLRAALHGPRPRSDRAPEAAGDAVLPRSEPRGSGRGDLARGRPGQATQQHGRAVQPDAPRGRTLGDPDLRLRGRFAARRLRPRPGAGGARGRRRRAGPAPSTATRSRPAWTSTPIDDHRTWLREEVVELLKSAAEGAEPDAAERYLHARSGAEPARRGGAALVAAALGGAWPDARGAAAVRRVRRAAARRDGVGADGRDAGDGRRGVNRRCRPRIARCGRRRADDRPEVNRPPAPSARTAARRPCPPGSRASTCGRS